MNKPTIKIVPCLLTFLRVAATPLLLYLIVHKEFTQASAVFAAICLTDLADGYAARSLGACTAFGAHFDVYADLIYILTSLLTLNTIKLAPIWFTAVLLIKFIEFSITSAILNQQPAKKEVWVFDGPGRCFSALAFLSPGIFCLATLYQVGTQTIVFFYLIPVCMFAAISAVVRITRCVICFNNSGIKRGIVKNRPRTLPIKEG